MKYNMLLFCALALVWIKFAEGSTKLQVDYMDGPRNKINLKSPFFGSLSSGILKSHRKSYLFNQNRTVNVSAPFGYGILVSIRLLDLRPVNQDVLKIYPLSSYETPYVYSNRWYSRDRWFYSREEETYFVPNGQIGITFTTGPSYVTAGYDGFELVYTVQESRMFCTSSEYRCDNGMCIAKILTCDGHNHCGDQSSERHCEIFIPGSGRKIGMTLGVIFACIGIGCGIFIAVRRFRPSNTDTIITTHPPPISNLSPYPPVYSQPGVYPPPPPPYSQGVINPGYH